MSTAAPRTWRALALTSAGALLAAAVAGAPAGAAKRGAKPAPPPAAAPRVLGVATTGTPTDLAEVASLAERVGRPFDQVSWYAAWARGGDFPAADASRITALGSVPELVWEPWDPAAGSVQPAYSLDRIAAGDHDAYLARWARQVKAWGGPLVIRLAHEMNGDWYPWAEAVNGNGPGDYVAAWRHVVGVFSRAKATNVTWTWAPNVPYPGSTPLAGLYPGDAVVGRVGLDGYNWGSTQPWSAWQSFAEVFAAGVAEVDALSGRPVHISETAAPEGAGGDKAAWVTEMWAWLDTHPEVRGLTWFSLAKEADWRLDSSEASLAAYRAGVAAYLAR